MPGLSVRKLDDETLSRLRVRAARNGVSMEEEARRILKEAVSAPERLGDLALRIFGPGHGVDLELPERTPHEPPDPGQVILLDTNVVSEVMRTSPAENVLTWLNRQDAGKLFTSTVTIGEIAYGLRIMPSGKRRAGLGERFERFVALAFDGRVLAYDEAAARAYGELMGERKELGRPMSVPDGQIAAIARSAHLSVATRNVPDFERCGIELVDPFLETP